MGGRSSAACARHRCSPPFSYSSAVGEIEDKVALLDMGANDYLTKPFAFRELAARVRALTRTDRGPETVEAAGLTLNTRTRVVTRDQRRYHLSSREFALLECLMRHAGETMARAEILETVWGTSSYTESNVVDVYVRYLRRKLDTPDTPVGHRDREGCRLSCRPVAGSASPDGSPPALAWRWP